MTPKHTPGPWTQYPVTPNRVSISGDTWIQFAVVVVRMDGADQDSEEGVANARLIAAAPDLLDALKKARDHLDYRGYGDSWERECAGSQGLFDIIAIAIAKAEGEAP